MKSYFSILKSFCLGRRLTVLTWLGVCILSNPFQESFAADIGSQKKILHIMSYHSPWKWTDDQLNGFKSMLNGIDIEYKVFEMDTKRHSSLEWKQKKGKEARQIIDDWKPDLVYLNDDAAQEYVTKYYINSKLPIVFGGVNSSPVEYGFLGSSNITGVLEQEHFIASVELLKSIAPEVQKIAVIIDDGPMWSSVVSRIMSEMGHLPGTVISSWHVIKTFKDYKSTITRLQKETDALAILGIFNYKDENGDNVPYTEVLKWTTENSRLPDFSFWKDRIYWGTLCSVTVSGWEQGKEAGKIAREILVENRKPSTIPMRRTVKGEAVINISRARLLGIKVKSKVLLTAEVVNGFNWEKE